MNTVPPRAAAKWMTEVLVETERLAADVLFSKEEQFLEASKVGGGVSGRVGVPGH